MSNNTDSQCYFVQLQIDGYLDGELAEVQNTDFMGHVQECQACAREFQFAQTMYDGILDLPELDCDEQVMEPIYRLMKAGDSEKAAATEASSIWDSLRSFFNTGPLYLRYSFPVALVAFVAIAVSFNVFTPDQVSQPITQQAAIDPVEEYQPEDVIQALKELNVAIDYLNAVSQRTEVMIGDRFLVTPLQDSLNASFQRASLRDDSSQTNDPI